MRYFFTALIALTAFITCYSMRLTESGAIQNMNQAGVEAYKHNEVTTKAVLLAKPAPAYTAEAAENDVWGVVRLRAVLSARGEVTNITLVKGLPDGLTERAIEAARAIKFTPAQKDGRAVSQWVTLEYNFNSFYEENDKVDRPAIILEMPEAECTDEARAKKIGGKVVLEVILTKKGKVQFYGVVEGLPYGLTDKAKEAALKIRFTPAEAAGRAVSQLRTVEYVFNP